MNLSIASFDTKLGGCLTPPGAGSIGPGLFAIRSSSPEAHPAAVNAMLAVTAFALAVFVITLMRPMYLSTISSMPAQASAASTVASPIDASLPTEPAAAQPRKAVVLVDGSTHGHVGRQGVDIVMDFKAMPRLEAALQLAALTDTRVLEGRGLLARAAPVTLQWRGRNAVEAWQQLLGENIRHAVHCNAAGCRVWILALNGPEGAMFTNGTTGDNDIAPRETSIRATVADPIEPETQAPVGPMNTPTPPDEDSESQSTEPDTTAIDPTVPAESGYTLTD